MPKYRTVDVHVGRRLQQRRVLLGLSQTSLGKAVGLTFQQVQKYERGANRIALSRLYEFAHVLGVPVGYFFERIPTGTIAASSAPSSSADARTFNVARDNQIARPESLKLIRAYYSIQNEAIRRKAG